MTNVLYVEDDAFVARMVKRRLENDGFSVTVSEDGDEGLEHARTGEFDIVLLDHMLPNRAGLDILKDLGPSFPTPVIMVSGSSDLAVAVEAMRIGASDYVIKETDGSYLDLLPQTVNRVLSHMKLVEAKKRADERIAEQAATIQGVLDNMDPGVTLFDNDLKLASHNDRFMALFELPTTLISGSVELMDILAYLAGQGEFGDEDADAGVQELFALFQSNAPFTYDHHRPNGLVIEIRGGPMPGGGSIASYTDITDRKRMEEELRMLATTDPLTGANNRRKFLETSERELARCVRYSHPLCLLMLDADHFKSVNDNHGHDVGDKVLKLLSDVCVRELRDVDVFGRFGGEEFVAALPETSMKTALEVAERLRESVAAIEVPISDGAPLKFTVSIGATERNKDDKSVHDLLNRADGALYQAKESGRNKVVYAE
jgi:two-component system cell cycle response regulator